jgi:hypothetical protein
MTSRDTQSEHALKSYARLEQVRDLLRQSKNNEREARNALEKSGKGRGALPLDQETRFLVERVELYNETAQIESELVVLGARLPGESDKEQIVTLARQLDLGRVLREERIDLLKAKGCPIGCQACVTSCTNCITDCTTCVSDCGLSGENFGSSCIGGTLVSACQPNPGF